MLNAFKAGGVDGMAAPMTHGPVPASTGPSWWAAAPGAEAVFAGEVLVGLCLWIALPGSGGDGAGWSPGAFLFLPFAIAFGATALFVGAFLHAMAFTRAALALAARTGRPWVAALWLAAVSAACALLPWVAGAPYAASWCWIAGSAVPPLLVARLALRTGREPGSVLARTALATGVLGYLAALAGIVSADLLKT